MRSDIPRRIESLWGREKRLEQIEKFSCGLGRGEEEVPELLQRLLQTGGRILTIGVQQSLVVSDGAFVFLGGVTGSMYTVIRNIRTTTRSPSTDVVSPTEGDIMRTVCALLVLSALGLTLASCSNAGEPDTNNEQRFEGPAYAWPLVPGNHWRFVSAADSTSIATIDVIADTTINADTYHIIAFRGPFYGFREREYIRVKDGYWYSYESDTVLTWANYNTSEDRSTLITYHQRESDTIATNAGVYNSNIELVSSEKRLPTTSLNMSVRVSSGWGPVIFKAARSTYVLDSIHVVRR